jgi:hypothetical protein
MSDKILDSKTNYCEESEGKTTYKKYDGSKIVKKE